MIRALVVAAMLSQDGGWKSRSTVVPTPPSGWVLDSSPPGGVPFPKGTVNGRFVIVNPTQVVRTTFLLDTATGRVWQLVVTKGADGQELESGWEEMPYYGR